MSNQSNTDLMERARYVQEQYTGTMLEGAIDNLIKQNDLEVLERLVVEAEAEMSREEFYASDTY